MKTVTLLKRIKTKVTRVRRMRRETIAEHKELQRMVKKFPKKEIEFYAERIAQVLGGL